MTFTILGRCPRTGRLGIGIATFSITVGRYSHSVRARSGVTISQAFANENNNQLALRLLDQGFGARAVLEHLKANDAYFSYRQIGVIDRSGAAAGYTGPGCRGWAGEVVGENYVATGNGLVGPPVVEAIAKGFLAEPEADLEDRLMMAIEAGRDAGGQGTVAEHKPERSAALLVYSRDPWPEVDVRVDLHPTAVEELRRILEEFKLYEVFYRERGQRPDLAIPQDQFVATLKR